MIPVPSIDFLNGRPCRLVQGDPNKVTYYDIDPVDWAMALVASGAQRLHLVDLDAALGQTNNREMFDLIRKMVKVPVQFGGGVGSVDDLRWAYQHAFDRVILGTKALLPDQAIQDYMRSWFGQVVVGDIGYAKGMAKIEGWQSNTPFSLGQALSRLIHFGFQRVILTNTDHDGTGRGPDLQTLIEVARLFPRLSVVASGGIATLEHIDQLRQTGCNNITECIIGRRLWEKDGLTFLQLAIDHCRRDC